MKNLKCFKNLVLSLLLVSCEYRWHPDYPNDFKPTVSIPYVTGDENGFLTAEVAEALSRSGLVDVVSSNADYRLEISIVSCSIETVGYRVDPQKVDGEIRHNLVATEGRKNLTIEASLFEGCELVYGPYCISGDGDYDYVDGDSIQDLTFVNPAGQLITVLPFSLGQLEPNESAQEAVTTPIYSQLAQKIVDAIFSEW